MLTRITNVFINILFYLIDRNVYKGSPHIYKLGYFFIKLLKMLEFNSLCYKKDMCENIIWSYSFLTL